MTDASSKQSVPGFHVVIPARYESTRLPGKPLVDIAGQPMIVRVARAAAASGALNVIVATDDERVANAVIEAGFDAQMTRTDHVSGSDRVFEVARLRGWAADEVVVNVQGDEPLIPPALVAQVGKCLMAEPSVAVCTLREPILDKQEWADPNCVKVVVNSSDDALLFSRAPIPFQRGDVDRLQLLGDFGQRHIGLYGYRVSALQSFVAMNPSALELQESLEQLRLLENGIAIKVLAACEHSPGGVDTPEDLKRIQGLLASI